MRQELQGSEDKVLRIEIQWQKILFRLDVKLCIRERSNRAYRFTSV